MTATKQAVIFDWNCTIVDDAQPIRYASNKVLEHFGLKPVSMRRYQEEYIVPINKTYKALGMTDQQLHDYKEDLTSIWTKHYTEACETLQLRAGAVQTLSNLQDVGHKIAVLSNFTIDAITAQAQRFEVDHYFDAILANKKFGTAMNKGGKGSYLKRFVERHNIDSALVVGDTAEEVEIAHAHGFLGVVITGGTATEENLRAARPDFLIHALDELPAIAQKVFGGGPA